MTKGEQTEAEGLTELVKRARKAYEAMDPVSRALADSDQRRSWVRGETGRDPGDVLADEVRRLLAERRGLREALAKIAADRPMSIGPANLMLDEWMDLAGYRKNIARSALQGKGGGSG